MLEQILPLGGRTLLVSISPFHNEYIPFAKVKGVLEACREAGVSIFPWAQGFLPDLQSFPDDTPHSLSEYEERFGADYLKDIPSRYWIHLGGRAMDTFENIYKKRDVETLTDSRTGCFELQDVSHFHFDVYGNYVPGLCSGINIKYTDMGRPLPEEEYPFITLLYNEGVTGLYERAVDDFGFSPKPGYISKCVLCLDIRRFLVLEKKITVKEFGPEQFYAELTLSEE
jgi:hypothetical protein